jgi:hypothetical protein
MDVHVKMEYGQGFEARGKDSTGHDVDLRCTPDGCHIASARGNGSVSSLMTTFLGATLARPESVVYTSMKKSIEMMPNPYIKGRGLYDVLVSPDHERGNPENGFERLDYYSQETGMLELRYVYLAPEVTFGRRWEDDGKTESESFHVWKYELVNSVYLALIEDIHEPKTKQRIESQYTNYANVELWHDT